MDDKVRIPIRLLFHAGGRNVSCLWVPGSPRDRLLSHCKIKAPFDFSEMDEL